MGKRTGKSYAEYTLEELQQELAALDTKRDRQHGRAGVGFDDPEKEKRRLWNNLVSRRSRLARRQALQRHDEAVNKSLGLHQNEDEYGIKPVDERRYKATFKSGYIGAPVYVSYIRRMTGLNLMQMYVLQEKTGLIPTPRIREEDARADWKSRYERGDIY